MIRQESFFRGAPWFDKQSPDALPMRRSVTDVAPSAVSVIFSPAGCRPPQNRSVRFRLGNQLLQSCVFFLQRLQTNSDCAVRCLVTYRLRIVDADATQLASTDTIQESNNAKESGFSTWFSRGLVYDSINVAIWQRCSQLGDLFHRRLCPADSDVTQTFRRSKLHYSCTGHTAVQ